MGLLELLLLAVGLSMDAFAVSVCKGLASDKITKKEYLLCGIWFGAFQGIMPFIGYLVGSGFERFIHMIAPWVAFVLLSLIGINMIRESLGPDEETPPGFDVKTMFLMAVATSIDALTVGITFVAVPVRVLDSTPFINVVFAVVVIAIVTFVISTIGVGIGHAFGSRYKSGSEIMGGTILIFIGFRALITYLDSSDTLSDGDTVFGMLIPLAGTLIGAALIYAKKNKISDTLRVLLSGSSLGIMLSIAVWGMIEPAIGGLKLVTGNVVLTVMICFFAGVLLQFLLDKLVPHKHVHSGIDEGLGSKWKDETRVMLAQVIHHIPEGIALGAIFAAHFMKTAWISSSVAFVLAAAIALQNIPEALYVSFPIRDTGSKAGKAFFMGVVSGVPTPLLGVITLVVTVLFPGILPYIMAAAGGALIFTTVEEFPQLVSSKENDKGTLAFLAGFSAVMLLVLLSV